MVAAFQIGLGIAMQQKPLPENTRMQVFGERRFSPRAQAQNGRQQYCIDTKSKATPRCKPGDSVRLVCPPVSILLSLTGPLSYGPSLGDPSFSLPANRRSHVQGPVCSHSEISCRRKGDSDFPKKQ